MPQLILVQPKETQATTGPADKMSTIRAEVKELESELESVRTDTQCFLEEKHKENPEYLPTLRNAIAFLPASTRVEQIPLLGWKQQTEISSAASFAGVFSLLKQLCEFPDSSVLEHIVRLFGNDQLKSRMQAYLEQLQAFRAHTKLSDFAKTHPTDCGLPPEFSILTIKLGREWHLSTLEDIEQLRLMMIQRASLTSYSIRLLQVEWEQGFLHWCVPSRALQYLVSTLDSEFLQENHVELLSINGTHLQSTQTAGVVVSSSSSSSSATVLHTSSGQVSLVPVSPPSGPTRQAGQPLSLQEQLAMVGTQVVQFKPALSLPTSDLRQHSSPAAILAPPTNANSAQTSQQGPQSTLPTAMHIVHPQTSGGGVQLSMGRPTPMPVVQHPGSQPIQIIHPQLLQSGTIATAGGKQPTQQPQVVLRMKSDGEAPKTTSPSDTKAAPFAPDSFMVMQGGPGGESLVFLPSYVMVKPSGQQKVTALSSPSSSTSPSTILSPSSQEKKSATINYQGLANLLQPSTSIPPHSTATLTNRIVPANSTISASSSSTSVVALNSLKVASGPSRSGDSSLPVIPQVLTVPNPAVSGGLGSVPSRSVPTSNQELSILMEMNPARPVPQMKSLNHICNICGNGYMWASSLKRHMHTHLPGHGERLAVQTAKIPCPEPKKQKEIECQVCHQMVESPAAYTKHLRLHMRTETNPTFFCRLCNIMFETSTAYGQHLQTHMQEKKEGAEGGGKEGQSGEAALPPENGERDSNHEMESREGEGEDKGEGGGDEEEEEEEEEEEGEAGEGGRGAADEEEKMGQEAVKSDSSSSSSDHSSDSASDTEEPMDTAIVQEEADLPVSSQTTGERKTQLSSTSDDTAAPPVTSSSDKLPFSQLLQLVGYKGEADNSASDSGNTASDSPTATRRFRCDECGRYLSSQAALSGHQLCMHNKQKPHVCHICHKGFFQSHSLTVHLRSHSGEKPYSCLVCKKSFSQRSSLNIHIRTHSGERPYQCPFCSRGFSDSSTLAKHRRTHTGERPYQCRECGASFSQSGNLWRHMKQVHPSATL